MKPLSEEEMKEKICPMSITGGSLLTQTCIGERCMMFSKQFKTVAVRANDDLDFQNKFLGYYCGLATQRRQK